MKIHRLVSSLFLRWLFCLGSPGHFSHISAIDPPIFYGFAPSWQTNAHLYHWDWLTHICLFNLGKPLPGISNATLEAAQSWVHHAHEHKVHVEVPGFFAISDLTNQTRRDEWILDRIALIQTIQADGLNLDLEGPIHNSQDRRLLTEFVQQVRQTLPSQYSLSFDGAWSPRGIDQRFYDLNEIALSVDLIFVMAYDMQSQIFDTSRCIAQANSPYPRIVQGLNEYLALPNVSPQQLVLGLPWYGYNYPCESFDDNNTVPICHIRPVPFRGAPCSDAAGYQQCFATILSTDLPLSRRTGGGPHWNNQTQSPYMTYVDEKTNDTKHQYHQVHYDNAVSLSRKAQIAADLKLGGTGTWNLDCVVPLATVEQRDAMYAATRFPSTLKLHTSKHTDTDYHQQPLESWNVKTIDQ